MTIKKAKPTTRVSTAAPARKKLTLKKDTLKDLRAATAEGRVRGGGRTYTCGASCGSASVIKQ